MRPPKRTAGPVYLWLSRHLLSVEAYFNFVGTSKRLPMWTTGMYGSGPYANQAWKVCGMLIRVSPARCTSIQIAATLGYE
jgi:hypothetical protein